MSSTTYELSAGAARAEALFASPLQPSDEPSGWRVRRAIAAATATYGVAGCAARVAQAYGEQPETAAARMRWARAAAYCSSRASAIVAAGSRLLGARARGAPAYPPLARG